MSPRTRRDNVDRYTSMPFVSRVLPPLVAGNPIHILGVLCIARVGGVARVVHLACRADTILHTAYNLFFICLVMVQLVHVHVISETGGLAYNRYLASLLRRARYFHLNCVFCTNVADLAEGCNAAWVAAWHIEGGDLCRRGSGAPNGVKFEMVVAIHCVQAALH